VSQHEQDVALVTGLPVRPAVAHLSARSVDWIVLVVHRSRHSQSITALTSTMKIERTPNTRCAF